MELPKLNELVRSKENDPEIYGLIKAGYFGDDSYFRKFNTIAAAYSCCGEEINKKHKSLMSFIYSIIGFSAVAFTFGVVFVGVISAAYILISFLINKMISNNLLNFIKMIMPICMSACAVFGCLVVCSSANWKEVKRLKTNYKTSVEKLNKFCDKLNTISGNERGRDEEIFPREQQETSERFE